MTGREHHHKSAAKRRTRIPPKVELRIPGRSIDVDAWLGKYIERAVEVEVHPRADLAGPGSGDSTTEVTEVTEKTSL